MPYRITLSPVRFFVALLAVKIVLPMFRASIISTLLALILCGGQKLQIITLAQNASATKNG